MDAVADVRRAEAEQAAALVDALCGIDAEEAALQARRTRVLAEAYALAETQRDRLPSTRSKERDMPLRSLAAELGAAVRVSDRTMQSHLWDAHRLVTEYPSTLAALERGAIAKAHATAIVDAGVAIDDPAARAAYERTVLDLAVQSTPARVRAYAKHQADIHDPRTMQERFDTAYCDRRLWVVDLDNGMSVVSIQTATALAHGIRDRVTQQARAIRAAVAEGASTVEAGSVAVSGADAADPAFVDTRTMDQIRADIVTDLLLTGSPAIDPTRDVTPGGLGAIRASVQITIPVTSLTGVTAGAADLDGASLVDPETARRLAGGAPGWDRVLTDPVSATVVAVDRYRPTIQQRDFLRARDQHCRFPGCRAPARICEIDHTIDAARGGPTSICNLACLCKRHHTLKHATEWTVRQLAGGILEWTSPAGVRHLDRPTPRVTFRPSDDDGGGGGAPFDGGGGGIGPGVRGRESLVDEAPPW